MIEISSDTIKKAVYELCLKAGICLNKSVYDKTAAACSCAAGTGAEIYFKNILQNAKKAYENKMPLCQDTGQTLVFLEIGQDVHIKGGFIEDEINSAVQKCSMENFFRNSIVKNAVFDRTNTRTNTPCIIYTKYIKENCIKIKVMLKGAGSENKTKLIMLLPNAGETEIIKKCAEAALSAGMSSCPPLFIGIGAGGTSEKALLMSKEALLETDFTEEEKALAAKIKQYINDNAPENFKNLFALDVRMKTGSAHIACLPAAVTINCHSDRFSEAVINENGIIYKHQIPDFIDFKEQEAELREINTRDIEALKSVKAGERVLLTGVIYTARDAAHKRLCEMIKENKPLPFDLKNKIIFYAGPCPAPKGRVTGSIGPTTASRMDNYAIKLYEKGVYASIGKGGRSAEIKEYCLKTGKRYFSMQGGIAALIAEKIKMSKIIAFQDLGAEAVFELHAEKLPVKAEF